MTFPSHGLLFDLTVNHINAELACQNVIGETGKKAQLGFASEAGILKKTDSFYHASSNKPSATAGGKKLLHTVLYPSLPSEHLLFCQFVTVALNLPSILKKKKIKTNLN